MDIKHINQEKITEIFKDNEPNEIFQGYDSFAMVFEKIRIVVDEEKSRKELSIKYYSLKPSIRLLSITTYSGYSEDFVFTLMRNTLIELTKEENNIKTN